MSIFNTAVMTCPACQHETEISWVASVNADRRPDLRDALLDGSLQAEPCSVCGEKLRLPPHLTYVDMARGNWLLVDTVDEIPNWRAHELEATTLFDDAFGASAPQVAQELAKGVSPRIVFGWPALREKVLCSALGIDDVTLELLKTSVIRNVPGMALGQSLRLTGGTDTSLTLAVMDDASEAVTATTDVPRSLIDDIAGDVAAWAPLRARLTAGPLVDVARFVLEGGGTPIA
jgi:hypothetical protein